MDLWQQHLECVSDSRKISLCSKKPIASNTNICLPSDIQEECVGVLCLCIYCNISEFLDFQRGKINRTFGHRLVQKKVLRKISKTNPRVLKQSMALYIRYDYYQNNRKFSQNCWTQYLQLQSVENSIKMRNSYTKSPSYCYHFKMMAIGVRLT